MVIDLDLMLPEGYLPCVHVCSDSSDDFWQVSEGFCGYLHRGHWSDAELVVTVDKSQSSQVINYEVQPKWEAEEPKPTLKCQNIDSNFREKLRNFIEFWRRIFISKKSYYLDGVTWPKTNKMSTISLKLQARPRTAPSTRDRKIGRLSRSDSQISLTSSIGTGRVSRTI